ncbi:MAG: hypothetical protein JWM53_6387 [bacterium]|nr:hypothetical protein [bacterium]
MALAPTRLEFRVTLSHVDRARDVSETVYVARHPSETQEHVVLRMLAWCLLHEDGIAFGPGLSTPDAADLWTHDATGRLTTWIEAGTATAERLRAAAPDAIFAAYGAGRQESFLAAHLTAIGAGVGMGVGGALDFLSGRVRRAPAPVRRAGLEWAWRLARQPWRVRRQAVLPLFWWLDRRECASLGSTQRRG